MLSAAAVDLAGRNSTVGLAAVQRLQGTAPPAGGSLAAASARWTSSKTDHRQPDGAAEKLAAAAASEAVRAAAALALAPAAVLVPGACKFVLVEAALPAALGQPGAGAAAAPAATKQVRQPARPLRPDAPACPALTSCGLGISAAQVVWSVAGAAFHKDVHAAAAAALAASVSPHVTTRVVGGGQLEYDAEAGTVSIWGYSKGYGRAVGANERAATVVAGHFGAAVSVGWTDGGY